jgi:PhnB protein
VKSRAVIFFRVALGGQFSGNRTTANFLIFNNCTIDLARPAGVFVSLRVILNRPWPVHPRIRDSDSKEASMPNAVRPIPEGYHSITPQLTCRDAGRAIDFYKSVFGAQEIMRMSGPGGKIMHAELKLGDSRFMLNDETPGMSVAPSASASMQPSSLFVYTEDVDALHKRALHAGAREDMAPSDMFWGDRFGKFTDPFGHQWGIATHVEDVAPEEMKRRSEEMTKQMAKAATHSD